MTWPVDVMPQTLGHGFLQPKGILWVCTSRNAPRHWQFCPVGEGAVGILRLTLMFACLCQDSITVHIRSTKGPIDVYLCEVEQGRSGRKASEGAGPSAAKKSKHSKEPDRGKRAGLLAEGNVRF